MKLFLLLALSLAICVLLARWRPAAESYGNWIRDYLLLLVGLLVFDAATSVLFKRVGLGEFSSGYAPLYIVIGLVTANGAATKAPLFWNVTSNWGFWASLP